MAISNKYNNSYTKNKSDKSVWKQFMNNIMTKTSTKVNHHYACSGSGTKSCSGSCDCDCDSDHCDDCECDKDKKPKKPNSETVRDDGVFCRKCNAFVPMAEPDEKGDGKILCYSCANPW